MNETHLIIRISSSRNCFISNRPWMNSDLTNGGLHTINTVNNFNTFRFHDTINNL